MGLELAVFLGVQEGFLDEGTQKSFSLIDSEEVSLSLEGNYLDLGIA